VCVLQQRLREAELRCTQQHMSVNEVRRLYRLKVDTCCKSLIYTASLQLSRDVSRDTLCNVRLFVSSVH
jgi:hypothetical protein